jgi:5-methylcytosine-specific restriction endonuclease McrA
MIEKDQGGSKGYRGPRFADARRRALYKANYRSVNTGMLGGDPIDGTKLQVDHIHPYRQGGISSHTNAQSNLRVTDFRNNKYTDYAEGFQERPARRRLQGF